MQTTTTHFKLESIRNSWVGEEAVALNYFDTAVGGELDTTFTAVQTDDCGDEYVYNDDLHYVETTTVTYAMMFGNTDRRLHTVDIDAVTDEQGVLWADSRLLESELC
tara:strand:+ start:124 stop:444 length:321 start_codon:yes stop_codon:yes gene_type:complete